MPLYQDAAGHLYWHEKTAPVLEPGPLSPQQAAHVIRPQIARIQVERAGWLRTPCLGAMGLGLCLTLVSVWLAGRDWPLALGLAVAGFLWCAALRLFVMEEVFARRVPFDGAVRLAAHQPWPPRLLGLAMMLSLAGPVHLLTWEKGLDGVDGPSVLSALVWAWLVWRQGRGVWRESRALRLVMECGGN